MKKLLSFALLLLLAVCFDKQEEPEPDTAAEVTGTYKLTFIDYWEGRFNLPEPGIEGQLTLTKLGADKVIQTYMIKVREQHPRLQVSTFSETDTLQLAPVGGAIGIGTEGSKDKSSLGYYYADSKKYKADIQYKNYAVVLHTEFTKN